MENADLVARVKVISVEPLGGEREAKKQQSLVSIEVLTKGVSAKTRATVLWDQALADATHPRKSPPQVGQTYQACLRKGYGKWDFEPVHPDWAFLPPEAPEDESAPAFIEQTVKPGDTLWALARRYYGNPQRWRVLQVANFENDGDARVYRLKPGTKLRVPTFLMKKKKEKADRD